MPRLRQSCQNLCSETKGDVPPPNPSRKKSPLLKGQLELHTFPLIKNLHRLVRPLHRLEPGANKPDNKLFHRVSASGRPILEDCTAEILLVELGEILDGAVERVDGTNLLRIRDDRQRVSLRGLEVHGADQGVAVDERTAGYVR
jgi:hypothetical protein